jgi:hypothetical protein
VLSHFFHDERITDQQAHNFGSIHAGFFPQDFAVIEFHEHHEAGLSKASLNHAF